MRPAIEVYRCASYEDAKLYGSMGGEENAAAVIEAYAAEREAAAHAKAVAEIVAMIHEQFDAPHIIDAGRKVAAMIEAKFGGTNG